MKGRELQASRPGIYLLERSPESEILDAPVHDGLFREFSDLVPDSESILAFAGKYGMLGKYLLVNPTKGEPGEGEFKGCQIGESFETWQSEIATMHRVVRIWDLVAGRMRAKHDLTHEIRYLPEQIVYRWESPHAWAEEIVASKVLQPWLFAKLNESKTKKLSVFLSWYLQITVNEGLKRGHSSARLLWDRQWERLGLSILPGNLLGTLWLQFAKAIEGDISHRRCQNCCKWFALGGRSGRSDKRFCSGTCKARWHRMKSLRVSK